jgi:hypothetical protein
MIGPEISSLENIVPENIVPENIVPEKIYDYNFDCYHYKKYVRNINGILGKRTLEIAFGKGCHDEERYGQVINGDFFTNNVGHGVFIHNNVIMPSVKQPEVINWRYKLGVWREKYKR